MADGGTTSGMVALVPSAASAQAMAVPGGEPTDELHATLGYLGDNASALEDHRKAMIHAYAEDLAGRMTGPVTARVTGHATFNPDGGPDGDKDPAAVHLVDLPREFTDAHREVAGMVPERDDEYPTFTPHVTGGYNMTGADLTHTGPVEFDRVRVAIGDDVTDYPITEGEPEDEFADEPTWQPIEVKAIGDVTDTEWDTELDSAATDAGPITTADPDATAHTAAPTSGVTTGRRVEKKDKPPTVSPDPRAEKLREYWLHGKGALKIRWGTPGDFRRCRRLLTKYLGPRAAGYAANLHKLANGFWPGSKLNRPLEGKATPAMPIPPKPPFTKGGAAAGSPKTPPKPGGPPAKGGPPKPPTKVGDPAANVLADDAEESDPLDDEKDKAEALASGLDPEAVEAAEPPEAPEADENPEVGPTGELIDREGNPIPVDPDGEPMDVNPDDGEPMANDPGVDWQAMENDVAGATTEDDFNAATEAERGATVGADGKVVIDEADPEGMSDDEIESLWK